MVGVIVGLKITSVGVGEIVGEWVCVGENVDVGVTVGVGVGVGVGVFVGVAVDVGVGGSKYSKLICEIRGEILVLVVVNSAFHFSRVPS